MAADNTLGSFSPYEGRIYAAFVGYLNVTVQGIKNPTTNTDIYLIYSDDGGRSWSNPVQVDDDDGATDGYSGANNGSNIGQVNGRSQYMPEVSVDPTTGTLVLSWRDARNDASNARVATYVASEYRRRSNVQRPDLRQPAIDQYQRDHGSDGCPRADVRQRIFGQ